MMMIFNVKVPKFLTCSNNMLSFYDHVVVVVLVQYVQSKSVAKSNGFRPGFFIATITPPNKKTGFDFAADFDCYNNRPIKNPGRNPFDFAADFDQSNFESS